MRQCAKRAPHCAARILFVSLMTAIHPLAYAGGVVDRAEIRSTDKYTDIEIKFNVPINITVYAPLTHGELLQIGVELPGDVALTGGALLGSTEWIAGAQPSAKTLYEYVRFDRQREPNRRRIIVKFLRDVDCSVYKSSDSRSVVISVLTAALPKQRQAKLPGTPMQLPEMEPAPRVSPVEAKVEALAPLAIEKPAPDAAVAQTQSADVSAPKPQVAPPPTELPPPLAEKPSRDEMLAAWLEAARQAFARSDYDRAIELLRKIIAQGDSPYYQDALETLALALQEKGDTDGARQAYEDYLARYPNGETSNRVRQRLAELLKTVFPVAASAPPVVDTEKKSKADGWRVYGGVSQYYRHADIKISHTSGDPRFNDSTSKTAESDLRTNLDFNARYRGEDWDMRSRFNGGYLVDFLDHSNSTSSSRYYGNKVLLSDAYVDVRNHRTDISAKVGRQYGSTGGVLGRFDGAQVGLPLVNGLRMNVVAGSPVDLTSNKTVDDTNSVFYGTNFDIAPKGSKWQYNIYAIQETIDSIIDRRAVGAETRYFTEGRSLFTVLDYDIEYGELNRTLVIGNWTFAKKTLVNISLDYGYSPTLTTRNALISQPKYSSIRALLETYSEAEIKQLARDRTARSRSTLFSVTQEFTPKLQLYGSVGQYYFGGMPASGNVDAMPATGNEYDYELQLIASSWLQENDTHSVGVRYYDGTLVHTNAVGFDSRFGFGNFRIAPRLWVELRKNLTDDSDEWVYRPGLRMEYSFLRRYHVDLDASRDIYKGSIPAIGSQDIIGNFFQLGYRVDLGQ
jgi:tetratricopeptide (TPR) repeat protein